MDHSEQTRRFRALARSIQDGNCILVLGAGASTDVDHGQGQPIHVRLARQLAAKLPTEKKKDLDPDDLRHVSQVRCCEDNYHVSDLQEEAEEFYQQFVGKTTDLHRDIAALPFRLCITTTPDDFLFKAFKEAGKEPVREFYNFRRNHEARIPEKPAIHSPVVYHLYGYPQVPNSLVLTENDLIDFLTSVVRNDPPLPASVMGALRRRDATCLFIDMGFKDWYLRVLTQALGLREHQNPSVALEEKEFFDRSKQHQTTVFFSPKTIAFQQDSLNEFAKSLRSAYEMIAKSGSERTEAPAGAPVAFLSYASEDYEFVDRLSARLKTAGIAVWQDKQNLRGGDNWEKQLTHVIRKQANYVVAVQTPSVMSRIRGVFNAEIDEALQVQREMPRFRFVIPVCTGQDCLLPELEKLHVIRIIGEDVSALAGTILEDWNARAQLRSSGKVAAAS